MIDVPPTPPATLVRARSQALAAGLRYVYTGNVDDVAGQSTYCATCGKLLIARLVRTGRMERGRAGVLPVLRRAPSRPIRSTVWPVGGTAAAAVTLIFLNEHSMRTLVRGANQGVMSKETL